MRRPRKEPPKPFAQALEGIDQLEQAVVERMVDVHFTHEQFVRWLYPDEMVDKLQAAFPFVRDADRGAQIAEKMMLPLEFPTVNCTFYIQTKNVRMLVPTPGCARNDENRSGTFLPAIRQAYEQHLQFEKVRKVVRWLNERATIGAARHYCPWLTSILPADHPFQGAGGHIFREPGGTAFIMDTMRECGAIMASALLIGPLDAHKAKSLVRVSFHGMRENVRAGVDGMYNPTLPPVSESYVSNPFGFL